jgi:hypothetical protein
LTEGLALYSPVLAEACEDAGPAQLRAMSEVGARLAVTEAGLGGAEVAAALDALTAGRFGEGPDREALGVLVEALDEEAFDLQDAFEDGTASEETYMDAFRRARAGTSLHWALHADPRRAAANALYEAIAALDERPAPLERAVLAAISMTG